MKVFSRWIDEMPTIAIASLVFSTEAFTCESHSGWSGWPSRFMRETKVSKPPTITMINRFEIMTTSIRPSTTSMMVVSVSLVGRDRTGHGDDVEDVIERIDIADGGADQVFQFDPEMEDVDALRQDQAQVERQLQPAAGKNQSVQRGELWGSVRGKVLRHRIRLQGAGKIQPIILHGSGARLQMTASVCPPVGKIALK